MTFQRVLTIVFLALVATTFGATFMITLVLLASLCNAAATNLSVAYQTSA